MENHTRTTKNTQHTCLPHSLTQSLGEIKGIYCYAEFLPRKGPFHATSQPLSCAFSFPKWKFISEDYGYSNFQHSSSAVIFVSHKIRVNGQIDIHADNNTSSSTSESPVPGSFRKTFRVSLSTPDNSRDIAQYISWKCLSAREYRILISTGPFSAVRSFLFRPFPFPLALLTEG